MNCLHLSSLDIFVSVYEYINSNMYVLISKDEALIVDPHVNEDLKNWFLEKNLNKVTIILTHEHCDHISGIWCLLESYECSLICSKACAEKISSKKHTRPLLLLFTIEKNDKKNGTNRLEKFKQEYIWRTYKADITYENSMHYSWQNHSLDFYVIRGHSDGSSLIVMDNKYAFTGDSLLKQFPVIVSFPGGNKKAYIDETLPLFEKTIKHDMTILPGHGKPFVLSDIMIDGKINIETR